MEKELAKLMAWIILEKASKQFTSPLKEWNYWQGYIDALQKVRVKIHELNEEKNTRPKEGEIKP